ncbi:TPA: DUF2737 domain-containing protein [Enterobacter asburiae]|nr:DUF2737 domain-containing protein [Enterobacter asburiae]
MIGNYYDPGITPNELVARHRFKPINDIPREDVGSFSDKQEAAEAIKKARAEIHGEFANDGGNAQ